MALSGLGKMKAASALAVHLPDGRKNFFVSGCRTSSFAGATSIDVAVLLFIAPKSLVGVELAVTGVRAYCP